MNQTKPLVLVLLRTLFVFVIVCGLLFPMNPSEAGMDGHHALAEGVKPMEDETLSEKTIIVFPEVSGKNLNGKEFRLPGGISMEA